MNCVTQRAVRAGQNLMQRLLPLPSLLSLKRFVSLESDPQSQVPPKKPAHAGLAVRRKLVEPVHMSTAHLSLD